MKGPNINGVPHSLIVLKVLERDDAGRPSKVEVGYDDTTFKLEGGEEFLTAFVQTKTITPNTPPQ